VLQYTHLAPTTTSTTPSRLIGVALELDDVQSAFLLVAFLVDFLALDEEPLAAGRVASMAALTSWKAVSRRRSGNKSHRALAATKNTQKKITCTAAATQLDEH